MPATVSENNTRITFTIDKQLKTKAEECAKNERRSLSNLINIALEEYLNNTYKNR
jgi:metal-responsive CopG/Arc/MetJ family transcriptional regulator